MRHGQSLRPGRVLPRVSVRSRCSTLPRNCPLFLVVIGMLSAELQLENERSQQSLLVEVSSKLEISFLLGPVSFVSLKELADFQVLNHRSRKVYSRCPAAYCFRPISFVSTLRLLQQ